MKNAIKHVTKSCDIYIAAFKINKEFFNKSICCTNVMIKQILIKDGAPNSTYYN